MTLRRDDSPSSSSGSQNLQTSITNNGESSSNTLERQKTSKSSREEISRPPLTAFKRSREDASRPPTSGSNRSRLQQFFAEAVEAANPSLRHIGSSSSLNSARSPSAHSHKASPATPHSRGSTFRSLEEQRYAGRRKVSITRTTRIWDPFTAPIEEKEHVECTPNAIAPPVDRILGRSSSAYPGSESTTLYDRPPSSVPDAETRTLAKYEGIGAQVVTGSEGMTAEAIADSEGTDEEQTVYPGPLGLVILITGIALSVFLISLDRTIITTAVPYISDEFNSSSDIGWYGSSYLLTASAFQPLYGRIFMLFNMKWSYLAALSMFELGSLICAVAPNSMALIIGRAIAGLGSAGILTGSFVVVSHAVPLQQRPVLTAVVGLMFGVGATVGPLLGGVFTDLVTWRWCFYFNLPVGGATFVALLFFFHPPKTHALMGKSFIYRALELDIVGNIILLGACVMLFLALQFTEKGKAWGSAEVIGLLVACGVAFILFSAWQCWKADGALMPPRILGQRTVAASCAAAFFIYSAILIQTYYLPMWFQAIQGISAVHSGVNMIPYVAANAFFSLVAGIFVSKNGYFILPAVVGMAIGTVGSGFISTFSPTISKAQWVGYEILASAGIGMAIQQGFTAVQIVLPLDEVAIGTAAVVAFQSLGGAVFVSVGNTILQNSLRTASNNNELPGVDIQAVINAGASEFRNKVTAEQLPALLQVYNKALQRVFIAAIPVAGLAVVACCFMEMRTVVERKIDGGESSDMEKQRSEITSRRETEETIMEAHRASSSTGVVDNGDQW